MEEIIPLFSCKNPDETMDFYAALGFEIAYRQDKPYFYAALQRGGINIHFSKGAAKGSACMIHVPDVHVYHKAFADGLRAKYGAVPTANFPRLTRLQKTQTRFYVFDPTENNLLFINKDEPDYDYSTYPTDLSAMERALDNAAFLRDTYTDDKAAAKMLDKALARHTSAPLIERARVIATRAELAVAMGDTEMADKLCADIEQIQLSVEERERYAEELQAADALERWIKGESSS